MADKRISQLVDRGTVVNNDVVPIVVFGAATTNKATISSIQTFMQGNLDLGVTSVGITLGSSGTDVSVTGSPITTSGNITINIPTASASARGLVSTAAQTFAGAKTFASDIVVNGVNIGRGGTNVPSNTRVGNSALQDNTTGANNTAVGVSALIFTTTGTSNTAIGHQVLSNANGSLNTAAGVSSLFSLSTGSNNLGLGNQAGSQISGGAGNTISNNSIFIGSDTRPLNNNEINQIVIGHQAIGQGSNTVTIGNSSITSNKFFGRVIHADAVNADESATLGQVNTSLGGFVTLGTAQTITAQKTFTTSGGSDTMIISHSGSGFALDAIKAGNGEVIRVLKTSGSGNAMTVQGGNFEAPAIVRTGGTSSQFLMADGSVNTNVLASGAYLPLAGGTLTGALNGTSAVFSGTLTLNGANNVIRSGNELRFNRTDNAIYSRIFDAGSSFTFDNLNGNGFSFQSAGTPQFSIASTGAATFSSSVTATGTIKTDGAGNGLLLRNGFTAEIVNPNVNTRDIQFNQDTNATVMFKANGNVGIGTATPAARLDVGYVAGGLAFRVERDANNRLDFYQGGGISYIDSSAASSQLAFATVGTERMRITSVGSVGIGTATPASFASNTLQVNGATSSSIKVTNTSDGTGNNAGLDILQSLNETYIWNRSGGFMSFATSNTERMRITSGGAVQVGAATNGRLGVRGFTNDSSAFAFEAANSSGNTLIATRNDGLIFTGTSSLSPYNNGFTGRTVQVFSNGELGYLISTRESKANIESIKNIDFISQLNPVQFNYRKKDNERNTFTDDLCDNISYGFIADEVEMVNKELVFYNEDGTLAGVEYNNMIAILTKAIQEQQEQINQLKNQINK